MPVVTHTLCPPWSQTYNANPYLGHLPVLLFLHQNCARLLPDPTANYSHLSHNFILYLMGPFSDGKELTFKTSQVTVSCQHLYMCMWPH